MAKKASARKVTASAKSTNTKSKTKAKVAAKAASPAKVKTAAKKKTPAKLVAKKPTGKTKIESTLEIPQEPTRELEGSRLTTQPKMKLPRKNERDFREAQQSQAQRNSVNPAGRR